jgi:glycosyltransferase involved in cell wall biosynthesis
MKKICHVTTVHPSKDVRIFHKECVSLANAGFDVTLLVLNSDSDICDGVKILGVNHPFKGRIDRILNAPKIALKYALEVNADIYHFHDPEFLRVALDLKRKGKKVIYDVHEDVPRQILAKYWIPSIFRKIISLFFEKFENRVASKLDYLITATPFIRDRFLRINKHTKDINNYPKIEEFDMNIEASFDSKNVCYIGGIEKVRGIEEIVNALSFIDAKLLLAGKFSNTILEETIKNNVNWNKVDFVGFLDRNGINELLKKSMAGLVTLHPIINYIDSLPVKMFEYMATGIPVIASNFPLWKNIIDEVQCGTTIDPLSPKAISEAIDFYIKNPTIAKQHGANGKKAIIKKYNWGIEEKKLIEIYKSL